METYVVTDGRQRAIAIALDRHTAIKAMHALEQQNPKEQYDFDMIPVVSDTNEIEPTVRLTAHIEAPAKNDGDARTILIDVLNDSEPYVLDRKPESESFNDPNAEADDPDVPLDATVTVVRHSLHEAISQMHLILKTAIENNRKYVRDGDTVETQWRNCKRIEQ